MDWINIKDFLELNWREKQAPLWIYVKEEDLVYSGSYFIEQCYFNDVFGNCYENKEVSHVCFAEIPEKPKDT